MAFDITQVLSVFRSLTNEVKKELNEQHKDGRIKGTDYATTYAVLMKEVLNLAHATVEVEAKVNATAAQEELYQRQIEGFDDDLRRKMLDIQMNSWAMMFSSGLLQNEKDMDTAIPSFIKNDEVTALYDFMASKVGVIQNAIVVIDNEIDRGAVVIGHIINYDTAMEYTIDFKGPEDFSATLVNDVITVTAPTNTTAPAPAGKGDITIIVKKPGTADKPAYYNSTSEEFVWPEIA